MKTQFANYKNGQLSINSYRFAEAQVTDVEDIIHSVGIESEEILVATLETDEELKALESLMSPNQGNKVIYNSIGDAETALSNSGVLEWFNWAEEMAEWFKWDNRLEGFGDLGNVVEWMYRNDATPEQAAKHFNVV